MSTARCPICRQSLPENGTTAPFCSSRCRLIDLGNWLGNRYAIPGDEPDHTTEQSPDERDDRH